MNNNTLDKLVWILLFGGLLVLAVGVFVQRQDAVTGGWLMSAGGVATALGAFCVWLRSTRGD